MLQIIFMLTIFHLFVSVLFGLTATQSPRSELPYIILRIDLLYFVVLVPSLLAVFAVPYNHIILRDLSICSELVCRLRTVPILPVAFPRPRTRPSEKKDGIMDNRLGSNRGIFLLKVRADSPPHVTAATLEM